MSVENVEIVRGIYAAWPRGIDAFLEALSPDIEWRFADSFVYGEVNPLIGHEALRQGSLKALRTDWDGFDGELDELLDAGDTIIGLVMSGRTGRPARRSARSSRICGLCAMARSCAGGKTSIRSSSPTR